MLVADAAARMNRTTAELHDDPVQVSDPLLWHEEFLDLIYWPARRPDHDDGYAAGPDLAGLGLAGPSPAGPEDGYAAVPSAGDQGPADAAGQPAPPGGTLRIRSANRAGAAALGAVAVAGMGVSAGVFGIVPLLSSPATAPAVSSPGPAAVPPVGTTASGPGPSVRQHAGYAGRHRKPVPAGAAGASPSALLAPGRATPSSPVPVPASVTSPVRGSAPPTSVSRPPVSPPRSGAGSAASAGAGGGHPAGGQGLVGGLLGGVTRLAGGLTSAL